MSQLGHRVYHCDKVSLVYRSFGVGCVVNRCVKGISIGENEKEFLDETGEDLNSGQPLRALVWESLQGFPMMTYGKRGSGHFGITQAIRNITWIESDSLLSRHGSDRCNTRLLWVSSCAGI